MSSKDNKIEEELNELEILIDRFKDGVNRCDISAIATNSRNISSRLKILSINSNTMTKKQNDDLTILHKESSIQFDRLSKGRCACSMVKNI